MTAARTAGKTGPDTAVDPDADVVIREPLISPAAAVVLAAGFVTGTAAAVLAVGHHVTPPGLHGPGAVAATWALLVVLATTAAELLRRHHRAMARHARRQSWRGVLAAVTGGGHLCRAIAGWARGRWENRVYGPLLFHRHPAGNDAGERPAGADGEPIPDGERFGTMGDPDVQRAMNQGIMPTPPPSPPPPSPPPSERTPEMADTQVHDHTRPPTTPAGGRGRASGRKVPAVFRPVIAFIDDFEPANDAELHDFLLGLAAGLHDIGASLADLYELCTSPGIRIGKGGMAATHSAADSIADASGGVSGASRALEAYYQGVSEEVAAGVELPRDGDFVTGDGASS